MKLPNKPQENFPELKDIYFHLSLQSAKQKRGGEENWK